TMPFERIVLVACRGGIAWSKACPDCWRSFRQRSDARREVEAAFVTRLQPPRKVKGDALEAGGRKDHCAGGPRQRIAAMPQGVLVRLIGVGLAAETGHDHRPPLRMMNDDQGLARLNRRVRQADALELGRIALNGHD